MTVRPRKQSKEAINRPFAEKFDSFFDPRDQSDGQYRKMTNKEFAEQLAYKDNKGVSEALVRNWRRGINLPKTIDPIVKVIRIDDECLAHAVLEAWHQVTKNLAPVSETNVITTQDGRWVDGGDETGPFAVFSLHPDNDGNHGLDKCRIEADFSIMILRGAARLDGVDRAVSVGLRAGGAELVFKRKGLKYEPLSMAGDEGRIDRYLKRQGEKVLIHGPSDSVCGRIAGGPLDGIAHLVTVERAGRAAHELTVEVQAGRRAFKVMDDDRPGTEIIEKADKDIILNKLVGEFLAREEGPFVLAKAWIRYEPSS